MDIPVAKVWASRFHQKSGDTNDWIFYVSRPTLEKLRKPDKEGRAFYQTTKEVVDAFLAAHQNANGFDGPFSIGTKGGYQHSNKELYATLSYPFDIRDEVDNKKGVVIHVGESAFTEEKKLTFNSEGNYPSMFDEDFIDTIKEQLRQGQKGTDEQQSKDKQPNPPGVQDSDPMWLEFASSKMLPTDQLLHDEIDFRKFRNIVSHQYIEVRLHRSRSKEKRSDERYRSSSREQLDALQKFESFSSGFSNFAGPPGTGKSTLLHMVCAHRLFQNYRGRMKDEQNRIPLLIEKMPRVTYYLPYYPYYLQPDNLRETIKEFKLYLYGGKKTSILYYLHSQTLRDEAIREIKSILNEVYMPVVRKAYPEKYTRLLVEVELSIKYVNQEQLISTTIKPQQSRNILADASNKDLTSIIAKRHPHETQIRSVVKRGLRNITFGMFGTAKEYQTWTRKRHDWNKHRLNFHRPNSGIPAQTHNLVMADFLPDEPNSKLKNHLEDFSKGIDELNKKNLLWDGTDSNQFWDPSCLFYLSHQGYDNQGPNSLWKKLENQIDWIVIDEVQDISLVEIRILLDHFSNRLDGNAYRDFRLIVAGDENQNVNHLLYQPQNRHFGYAFDTWVHHLKISGGKTAETYRLSQNLTDELAVLLKSGYRVFNQMFPFANDILGKLHQYHVEASQKGRKKPELVQTNYGRDGVFVRLDGTIKKSHENYLGEWQKSILHQLRKQMLTVDGDAEVFEPKSAEPIRVAFTYDKDDFDREFKSKGRPSPFTKRLKKADAYINEFAQLLDELIAEFSVAFDSWYRGDDNNRDAMMDEMYQALQLRGIMDVSSIKGLTMPVSLVLPSARLTKGNEQETMEDLSKFLVQITRAQYFNLIIEDTRSFSKDLGEQKIVKHKDWKIEDIGEWLEAVLNHSAGFDHAFNRIFQNTMEQYDSELLWTRLREESKNIDDELDLFVQWLEQFLPNLFGDEWDPFDWENEHFQMKKDVPIGIVLDNKSLTMQDITKMEQDYMLGEPRFGQQHISSLRLFLVMNYFLRTRRWGQDSGATNRSAVSSEKLGRAIKRWVNNWDERENLTEPKTVDWLKLFSNPVDDPKNTICQAINKTFDDEVPSWPQEPTPRLYMGGWRIKNTNHLENSEEHDLSQYAWMDSDSAYFYIRPEILEWSIIDKRHLDPAYNDKIRLFLGLTSLNVAMTTNALADVIEAYKTTGNKDNLDWFVKMFTEDTAKEGAKDYTAFKQKVRENLEPIVIANPNHQKALTTYLSEVNSITGFKKKLDAFGFSDWRSCIRGRDMFQEIVNMAYDNVLPVLKLINFHRAHHIIATVDLPKAIQKESSRKKGYDAAVKDREEYIANNYESILVDVGLEVKAYEYGFEKDRTRQATTTVGYDDEEIIEMLSGDFFGPDNPANLKKSLLPVNRDKANMWIERLEPFHEIVKQREDKLRKAEEYKLAENKKLRALADLKNDLLNQIGENSEVFSSDDRATIRTRGISFPEALPIYQSALNNPFARAQDNQMHHFFRSQLEILGEQENDTNTGTHLNWFNLLWGLDAMLKGEFFGADFEKFPLVFPSTKGEFVGKIHALVDAYCNIDDAGIRRMNDLIQPGLSPDPKVIRTQRVNGFLLLMKSMRDAYTGESKNQLTYLNEVKSGDITTLRDRIYGPFMERYASEVQETFLSYLTNEIKEGDDCILSTSELEEFLVSPAAKLVYATITGEFMIDADRPSMLRAWTQLKWKKSQGTRFENDNDDFMDKVHQNQPSGAPKEGEWTNPPLLHQLWFHPQKGTNRIPSRFNNAAVYRAYAYLALGDQNQAAQEFAKGGLHNHAAAIRLRQAYASYPQDARYELLTTVQALCAESTSYYYNSLYADHTHVPDARKERNSDYRYGIGPTSQERYKVKDTNGSHSYSQYTSISRMAKVDGNIPVHTKVDNEHTLNVEFFDHAHRVEHAELLRDGLQEIELSSSSPDEYLSKLKTFVAVNKERFTMFRDDVSKKKSGRGFEVLTDNRHRFIWSWNSKPVTEHRGGTEVILRKAGYQPDRETTEFSGNNVVVEFIQDFLDRKDILDHTTFLLRVENITGISGATLGYLNPVRCAMNFSEAKKKATDQDERERAFHNLDQLLQRYVDDPVYAGKAGARLALNNARNALEKHQYDFVELNINQSEDVYADHKQTIEKLLEPLNSEPHSDDESV